MVNKKSSLGKRYQASYESKSSGTPAKVGVMNYRKLEQDITFFSPQEGRNRINIIPYEIKTKNHPLVKNGSMEIGDKDYVMDIFVHRSVGVSEASIVCPKSTFGKPCPICEQMALLRKQGKEEEAGALKPSRRVFYNVEDLKEPGKLKIFETSHFLFEKELIDEARDDENGGFTDFADEDDGCEVKFRCSKVKKGNFEFNEFKSFSFEDREEKLSGDLIENAVSFDEVMNVLSYEEIEKILFGSDSDDDTDEEPAEKSKSEFDEDDEPSEDSETKVFKKIETEKEESVEPVKKECKSNCGDCPFGHKFGTDCDSYDDCDKCDSWDKCVKA